MRLILLTAVVALVFPGIGHAQDSQWTVDGQIAVVSDYRDRGYTLSDGDPAVQGDVTFGHTSGLYVGVWGASIDEYGVGSDGDGAQVEVALYAGWAGEVAGYEVDLGVSQNVYPDGDDVNYVEFPLQVSRAIADATFSVGVVWAPAQTGTGDEDNRWIWTRAEYAPVAWPVSLHAVIGHEDGGFAPDGKTDWRIGIEAPLGDFTLGLDLVDSDTEDNAVVASVFWGF